MVFAITKFNKRNRISNNHTPTLPTVYRNGSSECLYSCFKKKQTFFKGLQNDVNIPISSPHYQET